MQYNTIIITVQRIFISVLSVSELCKCTLNDFTVLGLTEIFEKWKSGHSEGNEHSDYDDTFSVTNSVVEKAPEYPAGLGGHCKSYL